MANITLRGNPIRTSGELPAVGAKAPAFKLTAGDLKDVGLADYQGKRKVLDITPSLDTGVCQAAARKFNERATSKPNVVVLIVSADLPFAAKRFCSAEGLANVIPLSTFRSTFAADYGVRIEDGPMAGLTARSVLVLDENDQVIHRQLVSETTTEPDYDAAFKVL